MSDSIVVVRVKTTSGRRRKEVLNEYCVEQVDEEAMTEFLQVKGCRRQVKAKYFDGETEGIDCRSRDSILCDWCKVSLRRPRTPGRAYAEIRDACRDEVDSEAGQEASDEVRGSEMIAGKLKELVEADELVFHAMDILKGGCVYCEFVPIDGGGKKSRIRMRSVSQQKPTGWVIGISRNGERIWILGRSLGIVLIVGYPSNQPQIH